MRGWMGIKIAISENASAVDETGLALTIFRIAFKIHPHSPGGIKIGEPGNMTEPKGREPDAQGAPQEFSEEEFKAKLREIGRLRKPTGKVPQPEGEFTPVEVKGKPLSESVVEDRR